MLAYLLLSQSFAVPIQFTQQGRILDQDGTPLEGNQFVRFALYDVVQGGNPIWEDFLNIWR